MTDEPSSYSPATVVESLSGEEPSGTLPTPSPSSKPSTNTNKKVVDQEACQNLSDKLSDNGSTITRRSINSATMQAISILPQNVVDKIAAGEVVQRPAAVVKELLENALDAGSTHIKVHIEKGGLTKISIADNGCGIPSSDLALAATRHATSKLSSVDDFPGLSTFGFRGEALASISIVSRLTVTTRTQTDISGFQQSYRNGSPVSKRPTRCARKQGTTIVVQDLFYNVPHRKKTFSKKETEEYGKILEVVQSYAIHYANIGFVCQRTHSSNRNELVELNTSQLPAVKYLAEEQKQKQMKDHIQDENDSENQTIIPSNKQPKHSNDFQSATKAVIAHVFGSNIEPSVLYETCSHAAKNQDDVYSFSYRCHMYVTSPSCDSTLRMTKFVVFLNHRLIECHPLKRACEDVYASITKRKPILVLSVAVPGAQVDVNVHPSKRHVALMYQDELFSSICNHLRQTLCTQAQQFQTNSVAPISNPYRKAKSQKRNEEASKNTNDSHEQTQPKKKQRVAPSQLVRVKHATPVGAIEPFLVPTQPHKPEGASSERTLQSTYNFPPAFSTTTSHKDECPLSRENTLTIPVDVSQPGAFAKAFRCTCPESDDNSDKHNVARVRKPMVRPKRVIPTVCNYTSIASLRRRVNNQSDKQLCMDLREAYFVGLLSHQRSLVQCGEYLVMINHFELAKEMFYQLALARFGGASIARFGWTGMADGTKTRTRINVSSVIEQALAVEDSLACTSAQTTTKADDTANLLCHRSTQSGSNNKASTVKEINAGMAEQATACLLEHAEMLEEYFMICIEKEEKVNNDGETVVSLTGLPVLLEGHSPVPHGLPIFLLRLATQVDWEEERSCFMGICRELGNYYAQLPTTNVESTTDSDQLGLYVQHTLFPAISYLLIPSEKIRNEGYFIMLTRLSTLYKVFERC